MASYLRDSDDPILTNFPKKVPSSDTTCLHADYPHLFAIIEHEYIFFVCISSP